MNTSFANIFAENQFFVDVSFYIMCFCNKKIISIFKPFDENESLQETFEKFSLACLIIRTLYQLNYLIVKISIIFQ